MVFFVWNFFFVEKPEIGVIAYHDQLEIVTGQAIQEFYQLLGLFDGR